MQFQLELTKFQMVILVISLFALSEGLTKVLKYTNSLTHKHTIHAHCGFDCLNTGVKTESLLHIF